MTITPKCETCPEPATVECTWGLYEVQDEPRTEPMQNAKLCKTCGDALWHRCKGAVNSGLMYWTNRAVRTV